MKFPEKEFRELDVKEYGYVSGRALASARWGFKEAEKQMLAKIKERKKYLDSYGKNNPDLSVLKWLEGELK